MHVLQDVQWRPSAPRVPVGHPGHHTRIISRYGHVSLGVSPSGEPLLYGHLLVSLAHAMNILPGHHQAFL